MTRVSLPWLAGRRVHEREDTLLFRAVTEGTERANLIQPPHTIEGIEKLRVARGELGRLEVTAPQIRRMERAGILRSEKMKTQPAPIGARNLLGLSEKSDKEQEYQVSVDPRLELEVAREIFRGDLALPFLELQGGMERMVDLLHERDQRPDVAIAQSGAWIVALQ